MFDVEVYFIHLKLAIVSSMPALSETKCRGEIFFIIEKVL